MRSKERSIVLVVLLLLECAVTQGVFAQDAKLDVTPSGASPAGSTVTVKWSGPNGRGDYIAVVRRGAAPSEYLDYRYTSSGSTPVNPVSLVLPAAPGDYEIRYVRNDTRAVIATVPYVVTAVSATVEGPASVTPGSKFEVVWAGPNNKGDWVTIVAEGAAPQAYGSYSDARLGRADDKTGRRTTTLLAPVQPGRYELRYVQHGTRVIGTRTIVVGATPPPAGTVVVAPPSSAATTPAGPSLASGAVLSTGSARAVTLDETADLATNVAASGHAAGSVASWPRNGTARYVVTVTNRGPAAGNGAVLTVPSSTGLQKTLAICSATMGAHCPSNLTTSALESGVSLSALPAGASVTVSFFARVTGQQGSQVTATSTVNAATGIPDPNPANNTSTRSHAVAGATSGDSHVEIETHIQPDPASTTWWQPNSTARYRATISAHGSPTLNAHGALLAVPATENLSKTSVTCTADFGAQCPANVTVPQLENGVTVPTLPFGGTVTFTFSGTVTGALGGTLAVTSVIAPPVDKFAGPHFNTLASTQTQSILWPSASSHASSSASGAIAQVPSSAGSVIENPLANCNQAGPPIGTPTVKANSVSFSWPHTNGASYQVWRNGDLATPTPMTSAVYPNTLTFAHSAPFYPQTTYVYAVTARYEIGCGKSQISFVGARPFVPVTSSSVEPASGTSPRAVTVTWKIPDELARVRGEPAGDNDGFRVLGPGLPASGYDIWGCTDAPSIGQFNNGNVVLPPFTAKAPSAEDCYYYAPEWAIRVAVPAGIHTWTVVPYWDTPYGQMLDVSSGARVTVNVP